MTADVVVVGGGAAGVAAALAARAAGASVIVVRRAPGATALSSGALDLAVDPLETPGDPWCDRPSTREAYARMMRAEPHHPLRVAGLDAEQARSVLAEVSEAIGLPPPPSVDAPSLVLATDQATFKSTFAATSVATAGNLAALEGRRVGVVGFSHHPAFAAAARAAGYGYLARRGGVSAEFTPLELDLIQYRADAHMHPHELAREVEREQTLARLHERLSRAVARQELTHLLFPPVMGLCRHQEVMSRLGDLGVPVAEILASPPAVPGLRLQQTLEGALTRHRIELMRGHVLGQHADGRTVRSIRLEDGLELAARAFVLTSGKFIGGGLFHRERVQEAIFDLPVWIDRDGPNPSHLGKYMARDVAGPHPLMAAGLSVDAELRPVGPCGSPVWSNLHAAGSVVGGYDYIAGRSGLGTAFITGWIAGQGAARAAGGPA